MKALRAAGVLSFLAACTTFGSSGGADAGSADSAADGGADAGASPCSPGKWTFCDDFDEALGLDDTVSKWNGTTDRAAFSLVRSDRSPPQALHVDAVQPDAGAVNAILLHGVQCPAIGGTFRADVKVGSCPGCDIFAVNWTNDAGAAYALAVTLGATGDVAFREAPAKPVAIAGANVSSGWHTIQLDVDRLGVVLSVDGTAYPTLPPPTIPKGAFSCIFYVGVYTAKPAGEGVIDFDNVAISLQ